MIETTSRLNGESVEAAMRADLARGDAAARGVPAVLRHFLGGEDDAMVSDDILARVRGMLAHLAGQLLGALSGSDPGRRSDPDQVRTLSRALLDAPALLAHLHALALEWQWAERLEARLGLDPVVPPLLQALAASPEARTQRTAMKLLAAQARWCQAQRRMQLAFGELPGDLRQAALATAGALAGGELSAPERVARAEQHLRASHDADPEEDASRLGLAARLIADMGSGAPAALNVGHAGVTLFLTALALGSGQGRDAVTLSTHEAQSARLALALRSAGLDPATVRQQMLAFHPDVQLAEEFDHLEVQAAANILADAPPVGR